MNSRHAERPSDLVVPFRCALFSVFYLQVRRPSSAVLAAAPLSVCLSQVAVQYRHIYVQSDLPSKYTLAVEHSASGHLPAIY